MSSPPAVTVVIPSYNHGRFIGEAIHSIGQQTLAPAELIVVDDGSSDNSIAVIKAAFAGLGRIACRLVVETNKGAAATLNQAITLSTYPVIAILNSDDCYAPQRLEKLLSAMPSQPDWLRFSGVTFLAEPGAEARRDRLAAAYRVWLAEARILPSAGFGFLLFNYAVSSSNFVFSRSLFDRIGGFDPRFELCHDWAFLLQALAWAEPLFIPEPLLAYRLHPGNAASRLQDQAAAEGQKLMTLLAPYWGDRLLANQLAPSRRNWPRFLPWFAAMAAPIFGTIPLAQYRDLADNDPAWRAHGPVNPGEARAIADLMNRVNSGAPSLADLPDLWRICAERWAQDRS